jgi:hypothetical protein
MSFFAFKVLFAALAIALLAALFIALRIVRRRRQAQTPAGARETAPQDAAASVPKMPARRAFAKAPARPIAEPEIDPTPAPPRRRQLSSFADEARATDQADAYYGEPLPGERASDDEPAVPGYGEAAFDAHPEAALIETPPVAPIEADVAAPASAYLDSPNPESFDNPDPDWPDASSFEQTILAQLETEFEALQAGEIALDAYRARILALQATVEAHVAQHQQSGDEIALEGGLAARESVRWCLDWADEQD